MQFCPDTDSKTCIESVCPAFTYSKPSIWQCKVCGETHQFGGTCSKNDHLRSPIFIKDFPYCKKYKKDLESNI